MPSNPDVEFMKGNGMLRKIGVVITFAVTVFAASCGQLKEALDNGGLGLNSSLFEFFAPASDLLRDRIVSIQNSDGGWAWSKTPEQLELGTGDPTEYANMFGVNAVGLVDYYNRRRSPEVAAAVERTAQYLMAKPLSATQRLFVSDCELLIKAGDTLGKPEYRSKGELGQVLEKRFLAAVNIYGVNAPTQAQIDALTSAQIEGVSVATLVQTQRNRLISSGRNAGLRAYDWTARMRVAVLRGDMAFHRAIAEVVADDFSLINQNEWYYLLGVAATIVSLSEYANEERFVPILAQAKQVILSAQQEDGWFRLFSDDRSVEHASIQDQGFVVRALLHAKEFTALAKLLAAIKGRLGPKGNLVESDGLETPQVESEILSALSQMP